MLVVEAMRKRVDANLTSIRATEKKIRLLLKEPVSDKRTKELEVHFSKNRKLLEENKIALAIQLNILDYIRYYGEVFENSIHLGEENESNSITGTNSNSISGYPSSIPGSNEEEIDDEDDSDMSSEEIENEFADDDEEFNEVQYDRNIFFENVIKGRAVYDDKHLLWDDEEFHMNLLKHYIKEENYEACAKLQELRKEM